MTLSCFKLSGQNLELFSGYISNTFYDTHDVGRHYQSSYKKGSGYNVGLGIDNIMLDKLKCRFTLQFDNYNGGLNVSNGGLGGAYRTDALVSKSLLSVGLFPLNFDIKQKLHLGLGVLFSKLINESVNGTTYTLLMGQEKENSIEDIYDNYSSSMTFGVQGRIACDIKLTPEILLTPQYIFHYGLTEEFAYFPTETKSLRHLFCLGLKKSIHLKVKKQ